MATIRLNCTVCPNCPSFSDLSHLLTHLASKGHLHHEFELRTESKSDPALKIKYDSFENWKEINGLDVLLDERIKQKGKKKAGKSQPGNKQPGGNKPSSNRQSDNSKPFGGLYGSNGPIDPNLLANSLADAQGVRRSGRKSVKREFKDMAGFEEYDPELDNHDLIVGSAFVPQTYAPGPVAHPGIARAQGQGRSGADSPYQGSPTPSLPPARPPKRQRGNAAGITDASSPGSTSPQDEEEKPSEYTTLKGITWPGMTIFDSADAHARRFRNQKKDASVLVAMKAYSETIVGTEEIRYFPSWEIKKTREITGQVDSEDEASHKEAKRLAAAKNRKPRAKKALTGLDANKAVGKRSTTSKTVTPSPTVATISTLPSNGATPEPLPNLNAGFPNLWQGTTEDDLGWTLASIETGFQDQRGSKLDVFRDQGPAAEKIPANSDETDMFVADTPTPKPQLPSFRALTSTGASGQKAAGATETVGETAASHDYRETVPVNLHRDEHAGQYGFSSAANNFDGAFPGQYSQRYFSMIGNGQPHMGTSVPPYMDWAIGHETGRLMPPPASFGNGSYNAYHFSNGLYPDNSFAGMLAPSRSPMMHQSPTRPNDSAASLNPLFEYAYLSDGGHAGTNDTETMDDGIGSA